MKRRGKQAKQSAVSLIEAIAFIAILFIVSASIQIVSNGRVPAKSLHQLPAATNQLERDFHAPNNVIHTNAPHH